jgi:hypothetical protein
MDPIFPAKPDTHRQDSCAATQGDHDAQPGGSMTAIEQDEKEEIADQACGRDQDILALQSFELDRAADGPVDGIDTRCHCFEILKPKKGLNDKRNYDKKDARPEPPRRSAIHFISVTGIPQDKNPDCTDEPYQSPDRVHDLSGSLEVGSN